MRLHIDIETFSSVSLKDAGVYKYAESPDFEILLFSYAYNDEPTRLVYVALGEEIPENVLDDIQNHNVEKHAHNAAFERICLSYYMGIKYLSPRNWHCTQVHASRCGLPQKLEEVGKALNIENAKLSTGAELIRLFTVPQKPTKANGMRTRIYWYDAPEQFIQFGIYNVRDVDAEREVYSILSQALTIEDSEQELYELDQSINDRGVLCCADFAQKADILAERAKAEIKADTESSYDIYNAGSGAQIQQLLYDLTGVKFSMKAKDVKTTLEQIKAGKLNCYNVSDVEQILNARLGTSKTSSKKYAAIGTCIQKDGRVRGLFQFAGAGRTSRWAGRRVQLQNLTQNHLDCLDIARALVYAGDYEGLRLMYGDIAGTLSQLVRTALLASPGNNLAVADFSAIEARVLAWLAGEQWRLEVFANGGDIYKASASKMYKIPIEAIDKAMRQKGKVSELALGYQGSKNAFYNFGAEKFMTDKEMQQAVKLWRKENPAIVALWEDFNNCAISAVHTGVAQYSKVQRIKFDLVRVGVYSWLRVTLPSGRCLMYYNPQLKAGKFGGVALSYFGTDSSKKFVQEDTYGGKITENITQAIARDLLGEKMLEMDAAGLPIVLHVHDEAAADVPEDISNEVLALMIAIMSVTPHWCQGLPLNAAGFVTPYYRKDD